jgi:putative flippase GtrA
MRSSVTEPPAEREHTGSESQAPRRKGTPAAAQRGLPPRYGVIVLGTSLLMMASAASVPLGPLSTTPARELLALLAAAAGLALLLGAGMRVRVPARWLRRYTRARVPVLMLGGILAAGTLTTNAGAAYLTLSAPVEQTYNTDILAFTHVNAELVLAGRNPYTNDDAFREALRRFPYAAGTPLRGPVFGTGYDHPSPRRILEVQRQYIADPVRYAGAFDPGTLHSYPALSFLLYVPFMWVGIPNILWVQAAIYWLLFAWLVWLTPQGWRHWGAFVALAAMPTLAASLIVGSELVCIALVLAAWHFRERRWLSAVLLGLACAYKQYTWFFVPFFALELLLDRGWRETVRRGVIALGVFLLPNLPYIVASPGVWFQSLWLPMSEPLFAMGTGIVALSMGHLLPYPPPAVYAVLELAALVAALWAYRRWRPQVGDAVLVLALLPMFFAFRSPPNYFAFAPWLALYAASRIYARRVSPAPSPVVRAAEHVWRDLVAPVGSRLAFAAAGGGDSQEAQPRPHTEMPAGADSGVHEGVAPPPAPLTSYYATRWPLVNRLLAVLDARTGGHAALIQRAASYLVIGGTAALVNLAAFSLLYYRVLSGMEPHGRWLLAFIVATEISILANFSVNDVVTFRFMAGHRRVWYVRCLRFHITTIGGVLVTLGISGALYLLTVPAVLAQAIALLLATAFNFTFHHLYTYRPLRHPTA